MPNRRRVSVAVRLNEAHQCDVSGCGRNRYALSRWCSRHAATAERQGHPLARPIKPAQWAQYRNALRTLYAQHLTTHAGLQRALEWLSRWIAEAVARDGEQHWCTEVARLSRHGCSALDVLTELAACWCYLEENPRAAISDTHRDYTLSRAVLGLAPRPRVLTREAQSKGTSGYARQPKAAALAYIGPHLVRTLAPLLVNSLRSLQTEADRARADVDLMRQPFTLTTQAFERAAAEGHQPSNQLKP